MLLMTVSGAMAQKTVNGIFTVNADGDQVQFASGNLRYTSGAWSFFDHQYDYYAEYSAASWDKFGWSTSGTTYGKSTSTNENLYKGDFVDWGNAVGTGWRTLSNDEWAYVVNTRSASTVGGTDNGRYAKAKVNDVQGLILFPDTYTHPDGVTAPTGVNATGSTGWNGNSYTAADWTKMESAGCVFLPAAGGRYNQSNPTLVVNAGTEGNYWSSTSDNSTANLLTFSGYSFNPSITDSPRMGYSVRLVKSAPTYSITLAEGTEDEGNWNVPAKAAEGATVTVTYNGEKKVKSVKAVKKAAANPKLGDLFYSDGTFSTELEAGKTPIGVIAYLDKEGTDDDGITEKSNGAGHGLVLCLKNAASNVAWSTNTSSQAYTGNAFVTDVAGLKRSEGVSGYSATAALATDATTYPAAAAAKNYTGLTAPTSTTGWFLPSAQQWVKMIEGLGGLDDGAPNIGSYFDNNHEGADKWENAIKKAGDGKYDSMTSDYLLYWSSSENSVGYAVFLAVDARSTGTSRGFSWFNYGKDQMAPMILVRPVLAF